MNKQKKKKKNNGIQKVKEVCDFVLKVLKP